MSKKILTGIFTGLTVFITAAFGAPSVRQLNVPNTSSSNTPKVQPVTTSTTKARAAATPVISKATSSKIVAKSATTTSTKAITSADSMRLVGKAIAVGKKNNSTNTTTTPKTSTSSTLLHSLDAQVQEYQAAVNHDLTTLHNAVFNNDTGLQKTYQLAAGAIQNSELPNKLDTYVTQNNIANKDFVSSEVGGLQFEVDNTDNKLKYKLPSKENWIPVADMNVFDGESAYETWLAQGNTGDKNAFLESLKAPVPEFKVENEVLKYKADKNDTSAQYVDLGNVRGPQGPTIDLKIENDVLKFKPDRDNDNIGYIALGNIRGRPAPIPEFAMDENYMLKYKTDKDNENEEYTNLGNVRGATGPKPTFERVGDNIKVTIDGETTDLGNFKGDRGAIPTVERVGDNIKFTIDGEETDLGSFKGASGDTPTFERVGDNLKVTVGDTETDLGNIKGTDACNITPTVEPTTDDDNNETGIKITFKDCNENQIGEPQYIYHGADGTNGTPGADACETTITKTEIENGVKLTAVKKCPNTADEPLWEKEITNGTPGTPGTPGADACETTITKTEIENGVKLTAVKKCPNTADEPLWEKEITNGTPGADACETTITKTEIENGVKLTAVKKCPNTADEPLWEKEITNGTNGTPGAAACETTITKTEIENGVKLTAIKKCPNVADETLWEKEVTNGTVDPDQLAEAIDDAIDELGLGDLAYEDVLGIDDIVNLSTELAKKTELTQDQINKIEGAVQDGDFANKFTTELGKANLGNLYQAKGTYLTPESEVALAKVTGLQTALDSKQAAGTYLTPDSEVALAKVTGLQTALDGKQAAGTYLTPNSEVALAKVTGLQTALDGKQAAGTYLTPDSEIAASKLTGTISNERLSSTVVTESNIGTKVNDALQANADFTNMQNILINGTQECQSEGNKQTCTTVVPGIQAAIQALIDGGVLRVMTCSGQATYSTTQTCPAQH